MHLDSRKMEDVYVCTNRKKVGVICTPSMPCSPQRSGIAGEEQIRLPSSRLHVVVHWQLTFLLGGATSGWTDWKRQQRTRTNSFGQKARADWERQLGGEVDAYQLWERDWQKGIKIKLLIIVPCLSSIFDQDDGVGQARNFFPISVVLKANAFLIGLGMQSQYISIHRHSKAHDQLDLMATHTRADTFPVHILSFSAVKNDDQMTIANQTCLQQPQVKIRTDTKMH